MRKTLKSKNMRQLKISQSITTRETESLNKYLSEIGQVDLIDAEEEILLAQKIRQGDQAALEKLTKANLRFVVSVAKQYQNQGLTLGDLISEGNLGLIKAAGRFDETKGFKFISYAVWWIRQSIIAAIADQSRIVRLPLNQVGALSKIRKITSKLEHEFEREPTIEELAEALQTTSEKVSEAMDHGRRQISFDAPTKNGTGETGHETLLDFTRSNAVSPDTVLMADSLSTDIRRILAELGNSRQRQVLAMFYGVDIPAMSLTEIGEKLKLTRERVRQIKDKALADLKKKAVRGGLQEYL